MKEVNIKFEFVDSEYDILNQEASSLNMTVEELIAKAFAVIFEEIREDVEARNANEQTTQ